MNAAPGSNFEATTDAFAAGATVGIRIRDGQGNDTTVRTTSGVVQDVTVGSSAVFRKSALTAPSTSGQYWLVWDDGTTVDVQELVVTYSAASVTTSNVYATASELKYTLDALNTTYMDDDIDDALNAASRAIDEACGRRFFPSTETRVYTAGFYRRSFNYQVVCDLEIDDLNTLTSLTVDTNGDGTYDQTWTVGTDFYLDPPNAPLEGWPYTRIMLSRTSGRTFPTWDNAVQIVGSFGWAETPAEVKQYCKIFAAQLLLRSREAPFGVLMAGSEVGTSARIARFDPDFERMLGHLVKPHQLIA